MISQASSCLFEFSLQRANIAALTAVLRKDCFKVGPWLPSENLDFGRVLTIFLPIRVAPCIHNVVYAQRLLFFWESVILLCVGQRLPTWLAPDENLEQSLSRASLVDATSSLLSQTCSRRN